MKHIQSRYQFINESKKGKVIYHFTESLDSLESILSMNCLNDGTKVNSFGRGYENISFTWNPKLWDIEYVGDWDYRWKVRITLNYTEMCRHWTFKPFNYGIEEEQEEIVETNEMCNIIPFIEEILISSREISEYGLIELRREYPNINFKIAKRKLFKPVEPPKLQGRSYY